MTHPVQSQNSDDPDVFFPKPVFHELESESVVVERIGKPPSIRREVIQAASATRQYRATGQARDR